MGSSLAPVLANIILTEFNGAKNDSFWENFVQTLMDRI